MADAGLGPLARRGLTRKRLFGLDRSGPPPVQTLSGQPLNPWTIPNAIGFARGALIPVFVREAWGARRGRTGRGAALFAVIAWSDYADGIAARLTGQYSRLGALMDPVIDRALIVSGLATCWRHRLLPRWGLGALGAREVLMLGLGRYGLKHGLELKINWPGRLAVWWTMAAPFWAMLGRRFLAGLGLWVGLALSLLSSAEYLRDGRAQLRARAASGERS